MLLVDKELDRCKILDLRPMNEHRLAPQHWEEFLELHI